MKQTNARERESQRADSQEKRDLVMSKIREAYFQAKEAADSDEFAQANALLSEALAWMKKRLGGSVQHHNPTNQPNSQQRNNDAGRPRGVLVLLERGPGASSAETR